MKMGDFFSRPFSQDNLSIWKSTIYILIAIIGVFVINEYFEIKKEKFRIKIAKENWERQRERERWEKQHKLDKKRLEFQREKWEWEKQKK